MVGTTQSHDDYQRLIRELSDRIVEAQRPIRILDAIKWGPELQEAFFASGCKEQPPVTETYYDATPLNFDPREKRQQFHDIERDITSKLGQFSPVGQIMKRMCREYVTVVRMLSARGTPEFSSLSQELYGSASDAFHAGDPTLAELGEVMGGFLTNIAQSSLIEDETKTYSSEEAVLILQERMNAVFPDASQVVRVMVSDGIMADAAAGSDYLKIRRDARFSPRDLRLLEVHEGWVHLGTTLNGMNQPICTFLSKGPPSSTTTQEGLAILMEIFAYCSYPQRLRRLSNRIQAVNLAEQGASFVDVFRFYADQGIDPQESYGNAVRVFRGSTPTGGPFTKDISYNKGFVLTYNYIQLAVRKGKLDRLPMLFCGKTTLEDMRTLAQLRDEGIVVPPKYLPPQFRDLSAVTAWMCYSNFLNRLNLQRIEADYANIL